MTFGILVAYRMIQICKFKKEPKPQAFNNLLESGHLTRTLSEFYF